MRIHAMLNLRFSALMCIAMLGVVGSPKVRAQVAEIPAEDCTVQQADGSYARAPITGSIAGYTLNVNASAALYSVLASKTVSASLVSSEVKCTAQPVGSYRYGTPLPEFGILPSGPYQGKMAYKTGIPGVGLVIYQPTFAEYLPMSPSPPHTSFTYLMSAVSFKFYFVKIGTMTAPGVMSGQVAYRSFRAGTADEFKALIIDEGAIIINPTVPTCTVSTPTVAVPLDPIAASAFANVNDTAGEKDFKLSLNCSGGDAGTSTNLYMTLTDQSTPTNRTDILTLAPGSTATGVGLQVLNGSTPILYGPESDAPGTQNQFFVRNIAQGVSAVDIPLKARYVRTGTMTPGGLQGLATFTVSYQ